MREKKIKNNDLGAGSHSDLILKNIDEVIYYVTLSGKGNKEIVFLSDKIKDILGLSKKEYLSLGKKILNYCHPEDIGEISKKTAEILKKKTKNTFRYRFLNNKKKKYIWIEETIYPQVDKQKKLIGYFGVSRNIDAEKQKEEELKQRWLNYRNLIESLPTGIFIHVNGKIIFGNKEAYRIAEITKNESLDKFSLIDFLLPEDRKKGIARIKEAMSGKDTPFVEYHITTRKGTHRIVRTKSSPIIYNATKAVQIILQDITGEKKLDEERVKAENSQQINKGLQNEVALRVQSEEKLKAIFNSSSHLIWTIEKNLQITSFNDKYAETVREQCGVILKSNSSITNFKKHFTAEEYKKFTKRYTEAFKGKTQQFEIKFTAIDGTERYREIFLHPTRIKGKVIEVSAIGQDITDRRNAEKQIEEQAAKLNAIFESTTHLIWTINRDKEIISYNTQYAASVKNLCGVTLKPGTKTTAFKTLFSVKDYEILQNAHKEAFAGRSTKIEIALNALNGKAYYREMHFHPIMIDGKINEVAAVAQDTTGRRNYEKQIIEQSARLKAIFESGAQLMWTVNRNLALTSYNKNYSDAIYAMYGVYPEINIDLNKPKKKFASAEYHKYWEEKYRNVFKGKSIEFDTERTTTKGEKIFRHIFLHPIYNERNEIVEVSGVGYDVTGQKKAEKQIIEHSSRLKAIFESGTQLMWTVNRKISLTSFNKNYSETIFELYGIYPALNTTPGKFENKADTKEYHKFWDGKYEEVFKGKSVSFYTERTAVSGKKTYRYIFLHPIYNEKNEAVEVSGLGYDISEQKKAEAEILNKQSQLTAIINTTDDIIFSVDKNFKTVEFNNVLKQIVKERSGQEVSRGISIFDFIPKESHADLKTTYNKALSGESIIITEIFIVSGQERIYEAHYNPIIIGGKIAGIAIFSRDITEQKRNEEEILKSLKEKDVLLKEVHHRVKNNLQVISSILNLQTAYLKDKATINILKECQNRIKTMAFIHESLYQNKDFSQINFSEYIVTLVKNLFYSFEANQQKIRANFDVEPIFLSLDTSIPCGLIVNELVSNALKYAFKEKDEGVVFMELKSINGKIKMVVADNGIGMPESVNYKDTETLGLQLVNTLTEQINGTISMKRNKGTIFEIIF